MALVWLGTGTLVAQVDSVDPVMGGQGFMLEPTRPTVSLPNSMVRVYPIRKDQLDDQIRSFPLTIISHRMGELFWLMPDDGSAAAWKQPQTWDQETDTPYYLTTRFDVSRIRTEFTPTARCGYFRFTFPSGKPVVLLANRLEGELASDSDGNIYRAENIVAGSEITPGVMHAYVYGQFNAPVKIRTTGGAKGKRMTISGGEGRQALEFRYGISSSAWSRRRRICRRKFPRGTSTK